MNSTTGAIAVESTRVNGACTIALAGELDLATVGSVEKSLDEAIRSGAERIVLDLSELGFMDATGIRLLLRLRNRYGHERLEVRGPRGVARRVVEMTEVAPLIGFAD